MFFFPMNSWDKLILPTKSNNFSHEFVGKIQSHCKNFNVLFSHEFMGKINFSHKIKIIFPMNLWEKFILHCKNFKNFNVLFSHEFMG